MAGAGFCVGQSFLYFGCRSRAKDNYYEQYWAQLLKKGILSPKNGLQVAFSRDQGRKEYVQELLAKNRAQLFSLVTEVRSYFQMDGISLVSLLIPEAYWNAFKKILQCTLPMDSSASVMAIRFVLRALSLFRFVWLSLP